MHSGDFIYIYEPFSEGGKNMQWDEDSLCHRKCWEMQQSYYTHRNQKSLSPQGSNKIFPFG